MHPKRKKRLIIVLVIMFGFASIVGLVLMALSENMNMFFTPTQFASGDVPTGPVVRVGGLVVEGSVIRNPDNLEVEFTLTDRQSQVVVRYDGILPDLFREGQGIVAKGVWNGSQVVASEVLAKHDETYMPPEVADALKEVHAQSQYPQE